MEVKHTVTQFKVKNEKTKKFIKDPISKKDHVFESFEHANKFANSCEISSFVNSTAFNNVRPTKFSVIEIATKTGAA